MSNTSRSIPEGWVNAKNRRAPRRVPQRDVFPDEANVAVVHLTHAGTDGSKKTPDGSGIVVHSTPFIDEGSNHVRAAASALAKWHKVFGNVENDLILLATYLVKPEYRHLVRWSRVYHYGHHRDAHAVRLHLANSYYLMEFKH